VIAFSWVWYWSLAAIAAAILLWVALGEKLYGIGRSVYRHFRPVEGPPPIAPEVVLGHPHAEQTSTEYPPGEKHRILVRADPVYLIENKSDETVRDITTGIRRKDDAREHVFTSHRVGALKAGESSEVRNVGSIPRDLLAGVHESDPVGAFLWWVRFTARDGTRWEVAYDPGQKRNLPQILESDESL